MSFVFIVKCWINILTRVERLTQAAKELSESTGRTCIAAQADVRDPKLLKDAVSKCLEKFGRIDFVICGAYVTVLAVGYISKKLGAAGNFLAPISGLSENAFRTVMEIDTVN